MNKPLSKKCDSCNKSFPQLWKNITENGVRKKLCKTCYIKYEREKNKNKKQKLQIKRKQKRERITEKKLDSLVSKVIRTLYGNKCCTCEKILDYSQLHCGHFISRQFRSVRFHPQNCASQCPNCNLYLQGAQYIFGKFIDAYHGDNTSEYLFSLIRIPIKIGQYERDRIYEVYNEALKHLNLETLILEYKKVLNQ